MSTMYRAPTILLLFLVTLSFAAAEAKAKPVDPSTPSVFIDSEPLGARINLDGQLLVDRTPVLLRGLSAGKHTIAVWKDDFLSVSQTVQIAGGQVPEVVFDLPPASVVVAFPENAEVKDAQGIHPTTGQQFRYPTGTFNLTTQGEAIQFAPVFPDEGLLTVAQFGLLVVTGAAVASTASDIYHVSTGWTDHPSLLTVGLWVSAVLDLPWAESLKNRKAKFLKDTVPTITAQPSQLEMPQPLFDKGEDALQSGQLAKAEASFSQIVREHPTSRLLPGAWFRLAKIHLVTGRRDLATAEYRLVAETYPQAAYYDKSLAALANLYEAAGNREQALASLNKMVLTDGFFDKADIDAQKARLAAPQEAPVAH